MKRLALIVGFFAFAIPAVCHGDIFTCMDCTTMLVGQGSAQHWEANCCTSINEHCYTGDNMVNVDVGAGCRVSEKVPEMNNSTFCISDDHDKNCPGTSGGGGGKTATYPYNGSCAPDPATGYCDVSCSSCA